MQQLSIVLALFILVAFAGHTLRNTPPATYKVKVCAGVTHDFRGENPDCFIADIAGSVSPLGEK